MLKDSRRLLLPLSVIVLGLMALAATAYVVTPDKSAPRASAIGGAFTLVRQDGQTVTDAAFKGEPLLVFFGYTHCPDVCPTSLFEISEVFKAMGPDKKVQALFITVDPARDTPETMKDYLSSFDPRIVGLSGDPAQTKAVEKAFRVYAKKVPGAHGDDYTMDHTAIVYLLDKQGRFVNAFNLERTPQEAAKDLERYL
nr:SCO family protein [Methyloferula stellata]